MNNNTLPTASEMISSFKSFLESVIEFKKNHPEITAGYEAAPYCIERAISSGADKVFLFFENYCGHYEDDDAYFTYWDEEKKEFFEDSWTTRFACPSYSSYKKMATFKAAWEEGLIDKEAYLSVLKEKELEKIENTTFNVENFEDYYGLRVKCDGGRKWKGEGYLISNYEKSYQFAHPSFRSRYYGSNDFGISTTNIAIVYDPSTNTINECNAKYLSFMDDIDIMCAYRCWASDKIDEASVENINTETFNKLEINNSLSDYLNLYRENHPVDYSKASYPIRDEKNKKFEEFKEKKMAELIEWVKNNTDKESIEIDALAEHIFNKRYVNA